MMLIADEAGIWKLGETIDSPHPPTRIWFNWFTKFAWFAWFHLGSDWRSTTEERHFTTIRIAKSILKRPANHHDDDQLQYEDRGVVCGQGKARATNVFPISPYTHPVSNYTHSVYNYTHPVYNNTWLYPTIRTLYSSILNYPYQTVPTVPTICTPYSLVCRIAHTAILLYTVLHTNPILLFVKKYSCWPYCTPNLFSCLPYCTPSYTLAHPPILCLSCNALFHKTTSSSATTVPCRLDNYNHHDHHQHYDHCWCSSRPISYCKCQHVHLVPSQYIELNH